MKTVPFHDEWGEEHADRERCKMCGADLVDGTPDARESKRDVAIIHRLALINKDSPPILQVLMRRMLSPQKTLEEIGDQLGMTRQAVNDLTVRAVTKWPDLEPLFRYKPLIPKEAKEGKSK